MATEPVKIGRAEALAEAYKRGLLPPQMKSAYEEAQKRGLVGAAQSSQPAPAEKPTLAPFASPNPVAIAMENAQRQVAGATMPARARQDGWKPDQWAAAQRAQRGSQDPNDKMMLSSWESYNRELPKSVTPMPREGLMFEPQRQREAEDAGRYQTDNVKNPQAPARQATPDMDLPAGHAFVRDKEKVLLRDPTGGMWTEEYWPEILARGGASDWQDYYRREAANTAEARREKSGLEQTLSDVGRGIAAPFQQNENLRTVAGAPLQFGQGLAEGGANIFNNVSAVGTEALNTGLNQLDPSRQQFTAPRIDVPRNAIVDEGGFLASDAGVAPRIAGQIMAARVPLGRMPLGGGVGNLAAKDAVAMALTTDARTPHTSDMIPRTGLGAALDPLRSGENDPTIVSMMKNLGEDLIFSGAGEAVLAGGAKALEAGRKLLPQAGVPTNAGGARPGSTRPMPPQTPANALASPPAPAQAASAAQPSVVPQPTVSQAGTASTGQQAGAGVGPGVAGGGTVPPVGPPTLQATPRRVPAAIDPEEIANNRAAVISISRFMRSARIPRNVVNDYVGTLLSRYEPLKSERYPLAFFVEEDLPQYLESRGYSPDKARNLAGDVAVKTTGYGKAANSFTGSGNSSRYTMQDTIHQLTSTQKSELEGTFKAVLGDETLMGRSDEIGALMRQNGEEAYNNSISEANRLIKDGKASPEQVKAAQEINAILTNAGFKEFYPESLTIEATTRGRTVDELIQERLAADPIDTAHWLQSEIGQAARDAKNIDGSQTNMSRAYETMRKAILDRLEKFDGYKGARMQHGDLFGADEAISFGDRFLTAARSEFKTDQMARELAKLSPRQQQVAALSIRDALLNQIIRLSPEEAPARITQLQNEGTLKALVTVLGEERGTELRNAIANMRVENQRIAGVSQANGSPTHLLQQGAKDAVDNLRGPANRLVHGAGNPTGWGVAGIASMAMGNPLPLVAKGAASIVDKLSTPTAKFQSRATRGLYGLPNVADDAAGAVPPNANALASPPPSGGPTPFGGAGGGNTTGNALSRPPPRTRAQRPPPTVDEWAQRIETDQNELQRLLKQYDQIDRADPNVDDLMRANLAKQKNARRRIAEKTKKMEAARAAQPEPEPAVPNAPQIAPANAFNAEPQAAAPTPPARRPLPGETSNASPAVTGALVSGGLTGGATYAATGDEDLALRAGGLAAIGGAVAGNRLAKFGSGRQPPKPPVPKAPVANGADYKLSNLSPGDRIATINKRHQPAGPNLPLPYWDAATAIKRNGGDRAAATAELQNYAAYLKQKKAPETQVQNTQRTIDAVAVVDPVDFDDAAFNASMKGRIEAGGTAAMEQGAKPAATSAPTPLKPGPKPPTRQGMGSSKLPMDEGATTERRRAWQAEKGPVDDRVVYHGSLDSFDEFSPKKSGSGAYHFSDEEKFAEQYAATKSQDAQLDKSPIVKPYYIRGNIFDASNPQHIAALEAVLPDELTWTSNYGWSAFSPGFKRSKGEVLKNVRGIDKPHSPLTPELYDMAKPGERLPKNLDGSVVVVTDKGDGWIEYLDEYVARRNREITRLEELRAKRAKDEPLSDFERDEYRMLLDMRGTREIRKPKRVYLDPEETGGLDTWGLLESREIRPFLKQAGFDGAIATEGKSKTYIVFDRKNIRRTDAKFDPAESSSSKLLAGLGGPSGAGAAGGGILGATLAPDANGDGTVDAQERANGFLGGAFSGGIAGKALGSRAAGKFGNRMKGQPRDMRGVDQNGIKAYHGSPHDFDKFELSDRTIGTGEGAQAYGHGLYFAENEAVAKGYRDALSRQVTIDGKAPPLASDSPLATAQSAITKKVADGVIPQKAIEDEAQSWLDHAAIYDDAARRSNPDVAKQAMEEANRFREIAQLIKQQDPNSFAKNKGRLYEVDINADPEHFLDWDKPLSEQPQKIRDAFNSIVRMTESERKTLPIRSALELIAAPPHVVSAKLREAGIPGIKFLDQGSRGAGDGTRNYVVFDDKNVNIINKQGFFGSGKAESRPKPPPQGFGGNRLAKPSGPPRAKGPPGYGKVRIAPGVEVLPPDRNALKPNRRKAGKAYPMEGSMSAEMQAAQKELRDARAANTRARDRFVMRDNREELWASADAREAAALENVNRLMAEEAARRQKSGRMRDGYYAAKDFINSERGALKAGLVAGGLTIGGMGAAMLAASGGNKKGAEAIPNTDPRYFMSKLKNNADDLAAVQNALVKIGLLKQESADAQWGQGSADGIAAYLATLPDRNPKLPLQEHEVLPLLAKAYGGYEDENGKWFYNDGQPIKFPIPSSRGSMPDRPLSESEARRMQYEKRLEQERARAQ